MSEYISIECPSCKKKGNVERKKAGETIKCRCGNLITVPAPKGLLWDRNDDEPAWLQHFLVWIVAACFTLALSMLSPEIACVIGVAIICVAYHGYLYRFFLREHTRAKAALKQQRQFIDDELNQATGKLNEVETLVAAAEERMREANEAADEACMERRLAEQWLAETRVAVEDASCIDDAHSNSSAGLETVVSETAPKSQRDSKAPESDQSETAEPTPFLVFADIVFGIAGGFVGYIASYYLQSPFLRTICPLSRYITNLPPLRALPQLFTGKERAAEGLSQWESIGQSIGQDIGQSMGEDLVFKAFFSTMAGCVCGIVLSKVVRSHQTGSTPVNTVSNIDAIARSSVAAPAEPPTTPVMNAPSTTNATATLSTDKAPVRDFSLQMLYLLFGITALVIGFALATQGSSGRVKEMWNELARHEAQAATHKSNDDTFEWLESLYDALTVAEAIKKQDSDAVYGSTDIDAKLQWLNFEIGLARNQQKFEHDLDASQRKLKAASEEFNSLFGR